MPEPDYLLHSPELQAFYELNAIRRKLGLGLMAQHPELDNAARYHLRYIIRNLSGDTDAQGHTELPGESEFTGIRPTEHAQLADDPGTAVENLGGANVAFSTSAERWKSSQRCRQYDMSEKQRTFLLTLSLYWPDQCSTVYDIGRSKSCSGFTQRYRGSR